MAKILLVYGTRPEAIKLAPLIPALAKSGLDPVVAVTGQHRFMLDQVNDLFGIVPDHDLNLGVPGQSLAQITSSTVVAVNDLVRFLKPDAVVVQGDTSTTFAGALAAFYAQVPIVHLEAGLRTGKRYSPFPEEMNRKMTTQLASLHLAPTPTNRANLMREDTDPLSIVVTGNTVIDALLTVARRPVALSDARLEAVGLPPRRLVLVTTHRRESWGEQMRRSMGAVRRLAQDYPECDFVLPMHLNPIVREVVEPAFLNVPNVLLTEPLGYAEFAHILGRATLVLTDSGGVQEEAPGLGKPVLVLRNDTERPEAVSAGTVKLVGTDDELIYRETATLLDDPQAYAAMANAVNPYGDGMAARRCAAAIANMLGVGSRLPDFSAR